MKQTLSIALLLCSLLAFPQQEGFEELVSYLAENREDINTEELSERIGDLLMQPVNLNTANEEELFSCALFSPFQSFIILKYRGKYGYFWSIYELAALPGMHKDFLQQIEPLVSFSFQSNSLIPQKKSAYLLSNVSFNCPKYYNHNDSSRLYPGSLIKNEYRFRYTINKSIQFGAAYEKDIGERYFLNHRPEHLSAFLELKPGGKVQQIILGNFRIHKGMGIVHGLGMNSSGSVYQLGGFNRSSAKGLASSIEYDYYRGAYLGTKLGKLKADFYASHKKEDLSLFQPESDKTLFGRIRTTGLHRSESEIGGIDLATMISGGAGLNYSQEKWNLGAAWATSLLQPDSVALDSVPTLDSLERKSNFSIYAVETGKHHELYCELAIDQEFRKAGMVGLNLYINPAIAGSIAIRSFDTGFSTHFPSTYAVNSSPENEFGINSSLILRPFKYSELYMFLDLSKEKDLMLPSHYSTFRSYEILKFTIKPLRELETYFRIQHKRKMETSDEAFTGTEGTEMYEKLNFRIHAKYDLNERLRLTGRYEACRYHEEWGKAFYVEAKFTRSKLSGTYRFTMFDAENYETRMYSYEPGVLYSFKFPALYGTGTRNLLACTLKIRNNIDFRFCLGYTEYAYKHTTGSGNNTRKGNSVMDVEFQIKLGL